MKKAFQQLKSLFYVKKIPKSIKILEFGIYKIRI
jgi:hypothetical protein